MIQRAFRLTITLDHKRTVINAVFGTKALGQTTSPGAFFTGGFVFWARDDVFETLKRRESTRINHAGSHQNIFIREGQQRPAKLIEHHGSQGRITLRPTLY